MSIRSSIPFLSKVSHKDKMLFAKHLSLMIKAGLPLSEGVETVKEQINSSQFQEILEKISRNLTSGLSLGEALSVFPNSFGSFFINIIKVGESSGTLQKNLEYLAEHLRKSYNLRKKVVGAMIYPAIILVSTFGLAIAMSVFILPKLIPLFESLKVELPLPTKILLAIVTFLQNYTLYVVIFLVGLLVSIVLLFRLKSVRRGWHKVIIKSPVFGKISQNLNMSLFSRTFGVLLQSGVPVLEALEITAETTGNLVYKRSLREAGQRLRSGNSISSYLVTRGDVYSSSFIKMVSVGERTGNLEDTLLYLADFYEQEVDSTTKQLSDVLEPLLLVMIGLVVGFIAISIIMPIYDITSGLR